ILNQLMDARVDQRELERRQKMKDLLESLMRVFPEGVHGRMIDLCKTTQRKYDVAIAIILGRNMEAVVVETEKIGLECIKYIREQRLGQATFIPLDTISVKPINDKYRSMLKGARLAIDVITFQRDYERAFQYACGNTLVCDTLEIAKTICYGKNEAVKAVTLDGTIIHKSGLITGGQSGIEAGARKFQESDFEAMSRKRDAYMSQLNELNKSKRKGNIEEQIKGEISAFESKLTLFREDQNATRRRLASTDEELNLIQSEIKHIQPNANKAENDLAALKSRIASLEDEINAIEDSIFSEFCEKIRVANIREYEQRQLRMAQEAAEKKLQFATKQSRLQNQLKFAEEQLNETADRLTKLQELIDRDTYNLSDYEAKRDQILQDNENISEEIQKLNEDLEKVKEELSAKTDVLNNIKKELTKVNKELDKLSKDVIKREDDIKRNRSDQFSIFRKCKLEEIDLPLLEGSLDDIPIEDPQPQDDPFEMDIDDEPGPSARGADRYVQLDTDWPITIDFSELTRHQTDTNTDNMANMEKQFHASLAEKNAEIERMAPNLKAIERLDVVEQRLQDTEKEFDSARRQAKTAKEKFNIIKQKRYQRFNDAYSHISERIDQIYKDLTKSRNFPLGGTAYLSLEDTEEPYLDGVKYHAMPPMKRFRDMEQLSGGEKTMAALALLFAIHSYQPSPFFVLDEVDAALDNTNVGKIANYIREHASDTFQFVVISLKSTLYEKAQALVGIYRDQEINSSKTITLEVDKYEE
ncbi:7886_t:CDS:10, partial [Ambispora leptoticha]